MRRGASTVLILLLGVVSGSLHDLFFINLNYQVDHVRRSTPVSYAHSTFQGMVRGWDLRDLAVLKWTMAVLFVLAMWGLCRWLLSVHGASSRVQRIVTLLFLGISASALVSHALARWIPAFEEASVNLLHAVQYPVLLPILWIALRLFPSVGTRPA